MKNKRFKRCLALFMAFSLVLGNFGTVAAAGVDEAEADTGAAYVETSVAEDAVDVSVPEDTEAVTVSEDGGAVEPSSEAVADEDESTEALQSELAVLPAEEIDTKAYYAADASNTTKLSTIMDATLLQGVAAALDIDAADVTVGDLKAYESALNFSDSIYSAVTKIDGLQYAEKAAIDISGCTKITTIPDDFFRERDITAITLPTTITAIGDNAFYMCGKLASVNTVTYKNTLPSGLKTVGQYAFAYCKSLTTIKVQGVMGVSMFTFCSGLKSVTIGSNVTEIKSAAFMSAGTASGNAMSVTIEGSAPQLNTISTDAFNGVTFTNNFGLDLSKCSNLTDIGAAAFKGSKNLKKVTLPALSGKNMKLGDNVFAQSNLAVMGTSSSNTDTVVLPDYINLVGKGCFYGDTDMTNVTLSKNLTELPDYIFDGCSKLATVDTPENCEVTAIGDCAFRGTAIANTGFLDNMKGLTTIGYQYLTADHIDNVDKAKYGLYYAYVSGDAFTKTAEDIEGNIYSLPLGGVVSGSNDVTIVDGIKQINIGGNKKYCGSEVFTNCPNLTSVTIPASVTHIGARAFYYKGWSGSENPNAKSKIETVTWNTSSDTGKTRNIYIGAFQGNKKLTQVTLPDNTNDTLNIGAFAFADNQSLNQIQGTDNILPKSVAYLGRGAFFSCTGLSKITIQSKKDGNAPELEAKIFERCTSMTEATVPGKLTAIPNGMFYFAPLTSFTVNVTAGSTNDIKTIGECAFMGCRIKNLDLSKYEKLEEIGACAFAYNNCIKQSAANEYYKSPECIDPPSKRADAQMVSITLPANLEKLDIGSGAFYRQSTFTTMKRDGNTSENGTLMIPDYLNAEGSQMLFARTGVTKAVWQADTSGKGKWTKIYPGTFLGCPATDAKDVLPGVYNTTKGYKECNYLTDIEGAAYCDSDIEKVDLRGYSALTSISSGEGIETNAVTGANRTINGAFAACPLADVKLPKKPENGEKTADSLSVGNETFYRACYREEAVSGDAVTDVYTYVGEDDRKHSTEDANNAKAGYKYKKVTVDLGRATAIEKEAFCQNYGIQTIVIPEGVSVIGEAAFKQCRGLVNVDFGKLTEIGTSGFEECSNLKFSKVENPDKTVLNYELPATLIKIGSKAFYNDSNLGKAVFEAALTEIGNQAFWKSGLTDVTFNTPNIEKIGESAFRETKLQKFVLTEGHVEKINSNTLTDCVNLISVSFGKELKYIADNAISGCHNFHAMNIYDYTTVSRKVFDGRGSIEGCRYTAGGNDGKISIQVTPVKSSLVVPYDQEYRLPYYVCVHSDDASFSAFDHMIIGEGKADESMAKMMQVKAKFTEGYYWNVHNETNKITTIDGVTYHDNTSDSEQRTGVGNNNEKVERIYLMGLQVGKTAELKVVGRTEGYFTMPASTDTEKVKPIEVSQFETKYNITIKDVPFHADIYKKNSATDTVPALTPGNQPYQVYSTGDDVVNPRFFYEIVKDNPDSDDDIMPESNYLTVETSNRSVVYPAANNATFTESGIGGFIEVKPYGTEPANQFFNLKFVGTGEADITVYPGRHKAWAKTFHYVVSADLNIITLAIPSQYTAASGLVTATPSTNEFNKGDKLNVLQSCKNVFGQEVTPANWADLAKYTNRTVEFYVNDSDKAYVDVAQDGTVTIKSNADNRRQVTILARAERFTPANQQQQYAQGQVTLYIAKGIPETIPGDMVTLYNDSSRTTPIVAGSSTEIDMKNTEKVTQDVYFGISNASGYPGEYFDCCDVVVTTNNPAVLYPAENSGGAEAESYTTSNGGSDIGKPNLSTQRFSLIARNNGTATITVYPVKYPSSAQTFTFVVQGSSLIEVRPNVQFKDNSSGATFQITKVGEKDLEGEVSYVAPKEGETNITIPGVVTINKIKYKVTSVPAGTFKNNKTVKSVNIASNVETIGNEAFAGCASLTNVTIPDTMTSIGAKAFSDCKKMTTVSMPNNGNLKTIGASAFQNCVKLSGITIPSKVTKIDKKAFYGCKKLAAVTIDPKAGLTQIGDSAFEKCTSLKQIIIPKKVTKIGKSAFKGCKKLVDITVKSTKVKSVGKNAFKGINKKAEIKVPKKKYSKYKSLFKKGQKKSVKIVKQ